MTDTIVLLRSVARIPYYHAGIGSTLIKPEHGEGTFSARELRITVGDIELRTLNGQMIRAVEVKGNPLMVGAWLDVDATPGLSRSLGVAERPMLADAPPRLIL